MFWIFCLILKYQHCLFAMAGGLEGVWMCLMLPCLLSHRHHRARRDWGETGWEWRDSGGQNTVGPQPPPLALQPGHLCWPPPGLGSSISNFDMNLICHIPSWIIIFSGPFCELPWQFFSPTNVRKFCKKWIFIYL